MTSKSKKISFKELLRLVDQLPEGDQQLLRTKLNSRFASQSISKVEAGNFFTWRIDIDELAKQQGVADSMSLADLQGDFWPEDEDIEEVVSTIRAWRQESMGS